MIVMMIKSMVIGFIFPTGLVVVWVGKVMVMVVGNVQMVVKVCVA